MRAKIEKLQRELTILNEIARALNGEADLDRALAVTLEKVTELFGLTTAWIWLIDAERGHPFLAAARNLPEALRADPTRMAGTRSCYCLDTYLAGDLAGATNIDVVTCTRLRDLVDGTDGLRCHASIPLYTQGKKERLGMLNVASAAWEERSSEDLQLLHTVGDLLSIAVERARLARRELEVRLLEERNRMAREIHDTLAQGLTAITLQLETADALLSAGEEGERVRETIGRALTVARNSLREARGTVVELRAEPLQGCTLGEAIASLAAERQRDGGLRILVHTEGDDPPIDARTGMGIYRIVQEALSNVARHAEAANVTIRLRRTHRQLTVTIADDGKGFDPGQIRGEHFGLIGMTERARLLGGTLTIESGRKQGTRIEITLPLEAVP